MKVYITVDMEGIAGVVHNEQTDRDGKEHDRARMLMTEETNAAIKGAIEAGAQEIIVNDSHDTMRNIYPDLLDSKAKLIIGSPKMFGMMEGINSSYDAALFIGYHTMKGTQGILNHTYNDSTVNQIRINNIPMGEFGINSLLAGYYDVPSVFISGCNLTIAEAKSHISNIYYAEVKQTIHRTSAENLHPTIARELIEKGVRESLINKHKIAPFYLENVREYKVVISFLNTEYADIVETLPIVKRKDSLSIAFNSNDMLDAYKMIRSCLRIVDQ